MAKRTRRPKRSGQATGALEERTTPSKRGYHSQTPRRTSKRKIKKTKRAREGARYDAQVSDDDELSTPSSQASGETIPQRIKPRKPDHTAKPECAPFHFRFNLSADPWLEYSFELVADVGNVEESWTSYRLNDQVLLLETEKQRFQLSVCKDTDPEKIYQRFNWCRVKNPRYFNMDAMVKAGFPLNGEHVELVYKGLDWNEIQWGRTLVRVRNQDYKVSCLHFANTNC